jgi:16S rRNA (cytosine967-C5)-methyltransferase
VLLAELRAEGHEAGAGIHAPEAVRVAGADPRGLSAVADGRAVPQDEASMMVVHATGVRSGDRALDLCSGPGGKATHLAQLGGDVVAVELHPHRADLVRSVADRLGVHVEVVVGDGRDVDVGDGYDVVLVDAPCTDLGTGRRRPEVRWRRTPDDVVALAELQRQLLVAAAGRVRPGGGLTYSVCTWTRAETEGVAEVIAGDPNWTELSRRQLWPHRDGTDGMFVASFRRHD